MTKQPDFVQRYQREIRVYEQLLHPNIVRLLDHGEVDRHYYIVMELIRGTTLRERITPGGMKLKETLELVGPILSAVHFANSKGIVHRDLKPENVMVTDRDVIKVMDFGLAKGKEYSTVTATGSLLGTPVYMAPEQIQGSPLGNASDQYAIGVMLFEMLAGQLPFDDENPVAILMKHISEPPPSLAKMRPDLVKVAPVVEKMLAKKPEERYADLEQARAALQHAFHQTF
ncbi:unnamed protein product [Phaeothamnion confervicola]